jgi:predicted nucleic acid-binding protein
VGRWAERSLRIHGALAPVECQFYNLYFDAVHKWVDVDPTLVELALQRGAEFGLNGMDALHVAAAETATAAELVTTERATSPLRRVTSSQAVSVRP